MFPGKVQRSSLQWDQSRVCRFYLHKQKFLTSLSDQINQSAQIRTVLCGLLVADHVVDELFDSRVREQRASLFKKLLPELLPLRQAHTSCVAHSGYVRGDVEAEIFDNETLRDKQPLSQALRNIPQALLKYSVESPVSQMPV